MVLTQIYNELFQIYFKIYFKFTWEIAHVLFVCHNNVYFLKIVTLSLQIIPFTF